MSNGSTEAANNLIRRIKMVGVGFSRFTHYQIRALLYAGRPNWDLLATITRHPLKSDEPSNAGPSRAAVGVMSSPFGYVRRRGSGQARSAGILG